MGEESQYKGELWTKQAIKLLDLFSWNKIGDSGMDLEGYDKEHEYGVDCLYSYKNPAKDIPESIILEAKCYATKNVNNAVIRQWVDRLNTKVTDLRGARELLERHPVLKDCTELKIGLIFIWFSDFENYKKFQPKFTEMLNNVKPSPKPFKHKTYNKIYVMDNDKISKLCSIHNVIKELDSFNFYYPSPFINDKAVSRTSVLSLEYIFSKFILGKSRSKDNSKEQNIVFYFGDLTTNSFKLLKKALSSLSFIDQEYNLIVYKYQRDEKFRQIKPDIEAFYANDGIKFEIRDMDSCMELPAFLTNNL